MGQVRQAVYADAQLSEWGGMAMHRKDWAVVTTARFETAATDAPATVVAGLLGFMDQRNGALDRWGPQIESALEDLGVAAVPPSIEELQAPYRAALLVGDAIVEIEVDTTSYEIILRELIYP